MNNKSEMLLAPLLKLDCFLFGVILDCNPDGRIGPNS